jgi:hypothetical protein
MRSMERERWRGDAKSKKREEKKKAGNMSWLDCNEWMDLPFA